MLLERYSCRNYLYSECDSSLFTRDIHSRSYSKWTHSPSKVDTVQLLLAIVRITLATYWKKKQIPSVYLWRRKLWGYFTLGKIQWQTTGENFVNIWNKFIVQWLPIVEYWSKHNVIPTNPYYLKLLYFWDMKTTAEWIDILQLYLVELRYCTY